MESVKKSPKSIKMIGEKGRSEGPVAPPNIFEDNTTQEKQNFSLCILCSVMSSLFTGANVPIPT